MYNYSMQILVATIGGLYLIIATAASAQAQTPTIWLSASGQYDECVKTGGQMPEYFQSVSLELIEDTILFSVETKEHGTFPTVYQPDGLVRRGRDYHYQADGTVLADLPSHEASFWEDDQLVREEVTYLPNGSHVIETNRIWITETGELSYELYVDETLWLTASCH